SDTGPECAQTDDNTASKGNESNVGHDNSLVTKLMSLKFKKTTKQKNLQSCPSRPTPARGKQHTVSRAWPIYTSVSIMNIKACKRTIKIWNMAHAEPARMCPIPNPRLAPLKPVHAPPNRAISMNTNSPANMFPKSRMPKETVLAAYSIRFSRILKGARKIMAIPLAVKGVVNKPLAKPAGFLILTP